MHFARCHLQSLPIGLGLALLVSMPSSRNPASAAEPPIDFASQVRPILSDRCFACHGPDAAVRVSDLRLDNEQSVHQWAVSAGDADSSELIRRIESSDPDEVMPPPDSKLQLSSQERELLRKWIDAGAKFAKHWALVAPKKSPLPELPESDPWKSSDHAIDRWIADKLIELGMERSPEADRATLIRRLSLDLIGLPPTPEEIDEFEQAEAPDAYEQWVDRLLASPKFGEKWASDWLDVARYADTYGYQADVYRATWPWRDWVVEALNRNLPYDQFVTWQLAGDLLPDATQEQILATAFNRHHRQTNEGGSVEEEFRTEYVADRVNTFGAAFLGLTLECARCHDHKYDPVTQREYYQLATFFNSIDESGLYSHFTSAVPTPTLKLSTDDQKTSIADYQKEIAEKEAMLKAYDQTTEDRLSLSRSDQEQEVLSEESMLPILERLGRLQVAHYRFDSVDDGKLQNETSGQWTGRVAENPVSVDGIRGKGFLLSGENSITIPEGGKWTRNDPFSIALWIQAPREFDRCVILHRSRAWTDAGSRGYELLIEDGRLSVALVHFWPGNAVRIQTSDPLPLSRWCHVAITYDGSSKAEGLHLYLDGVPVETSVVRDHLTSAIHGDEAQELTIGQRFRDVGFKDGRVDELRIFDAELSEYEINLVIGMDLASDSPDLRIPTRFVAGPAMKERLDRLRSQVRNDLVAELHRLRDALSNLAEPIPEVMVMREMPEPRPTTILHRGEYDAPGDRVDRGFPSSIFQSPTPKESDHPLNRLGLARWLLDPEHPLTSRVAVNRIWQSLFGTGLVSTSEDFGSQGSAPSHPELLDWLAVQYVESGWDTKAIIQRIVLSQAYRQRSDLNAELVRLDPENRFLARGPVVRLSAEAVRDAALFTSGLMVDRMGGPPVKPYQPDGLWEEKSGTSYHRDRDEGSRRRSLYTFWKRTSPPPSMMTFDASNREVCMVRRQSTMTPLQTLVLLNDPQFVEAARGLAQRAFLESDDSSQRLAAIYRRLTSHRPTEEKLRILSQLFAEQLDVFRKDPSLADQFLNVGDYRFDDSLDKPTIAALAVVAEGLMSFDGFVMKR